METLSQLAAMLPAASFRPSRVRAETAEETYAWHNDSKSVFAEFGPCQCNGCEVYRAAKKAA